MSLGVFDTDDIFALQSLTAAINEIPRVKTPLADAGLFDEQPISTLSVNIERENQALALIPKSNRGQAGAARAGSTRSMNSIETVNLKLTGAITADEVQNVRAFGTTDQLQGYMSIVNRHLATDARRHDLTLEYQRAGALQGKVFDANGTTVLADFYALFGFARPAATISVAAATIEASVTAVKDMSSDAASDAIVTGFVAYCGRTFFDAVAASPVIQEWRKHADPAGLLSGTGESFTYNGVKFVRYRGGIGGSPFIPDAEAVLVPETASPIFQTAFAPADYVETVNTMGLPRYAKQWDTDNSGRSRTIETQSQTLSFPLRPRAVIKLTIAASS